MLRPLFLKDAGRSMGLTSESCDDSKIAKRNGVGVADVLYEAIESFVAKCEAEADLEEKVIKFPTVADRWRLMDH
jgi:hypothetical protein